jgi:hypothetical protein
MLGADERRSLSGVSADKRSMRVSVVSALCGDVDVCEGVAKGEGICSLCAELCACTSGGGDCAAQLHTRAHTESSVTSHSQRAHTHSTHPVPGSVCRGMCKGTGALKYGAGAANAYTN